MYRGFSDAVTEQLLSTALIDPSPSFTPQMRNRRSLGNLSDFDKRRTTMRAMDPRGDATRLRSCSDPGKKRKYITEFMFIRQDVYMIFVQVLYFLTDLNCVNYAAGHDGEFPRDRAHSQFEL